MKLSECRHGRIIVRVMDRCPQKIGMIVGIAEMTIAAAMEASVAGQPEFAIPLVQWSTGETSPINHENLEPYEG